MVARSGLKISDRGQASLGTWTGSKPCTNIRRREDLRKGQADPGVVPGGERVSEASQRMCGCVQVDMHG